MKGGGAGRDSHCDTSREFPSAEGSPEMTSHTANDSHDCGLNNKGHSADSKIIKSR